MDFIISHAPSRWGLPIVVFGSIFGIFSFVEKVVAQEIRTDLSQFLKGQGYGHTIEALSQSVQRVFFSIFGPRHFSWKCFLSSVGFSLFSVILTFLISLVWNYNDFVKIGPVWHKVITTLLNSPNANIKQVGLWITQIPQSYIIAVCVIIWLFWCILPDYLALLKIRIMLTVFKYTKPKFSSLLVTLVIDFIIGMWTFLTSFAIIQSMSLILLLLEHKSNLITGLSSAIIWFFILGGFLFVVEAALFIFTTAIFFVVPVANLFWASMIPSLWLWAYIFAALLTRACMISRPALVSFLDTANHPLRSIGIVAGFWSAVVSLAMLAGLSLV